jgi:virulence factor Mce-like protein
MFEIRPGQHRPKNIRNGAIFVVLVAIFLFVLYAKPTVPGFGKTGQEITADVTNGINIRKGSTPVRVKGVDVGNITKIERGPGGRGVRVTMLIEKGKGVTVHNDARADFRWRTVLGRNLYVDLQPGSNSAPKLAKSDPIPTSRTTVQTELDQALDPLDADGQKAVKTIITEFDKGFGSAKAYKETVKNLGPAVNKLGAGLNSIRGTEDGDLQKMIVGTSRTMGALAKNESQLAGLIDNGNVALGVTAARSQDLSNTLGTAPGALAETRLTMARLRTTLDTLDPVAQQLRPGARKLPGAADNARVLLTAATPLLADAKPTVRALKPAVQDLLKLTTSGNNLMATANPVLDDAVYPILPYLRMRDVDSKKKEYEMIGPALSAANGVVGKADIFTTLANFEAGAGDGSIPIVSPCSTFLTDTQVPLEKKIQCDGISRIIATVLTGAPPQDTTIVSGAAAPQSKSRALVESPSKLADLLKTVTKTAKLNEKSAKSKQEAGR